MNVSSDGNVSADVVEKAAMLSENIVRILMMAGEPDSESPNELNVSQSSIPQRGDLAQYLWKQSSNTLPTVASQSVLESEASQYSETKRSPVAFLMQELGLISEEGRLPRSVNALDHPRLFHHCTEEDQRFFDNDAVRAIYDSDIETLRVWLKVGRPLSTSNQFGETLLHMACRRGLLDVVAFLVLEAKITLWVHDEQGKTPLHDACHSINPPFELVEFVIQQDPDLLFVADTRGYMPLDYAPRDTWDAWIDFLHDKEFRRIMPRRPEFFSAMKKNDSTTRSSDFALPFLEDIDQILADFSSSRKKSKKKKKKSHHSKGSKGSSKGDHSSSDDEPPSRVKLKRNITEAIIQNLQRGDAVDSTRRNLTLLEELSSLPPEMLMAAIQKQRTHVDENIDRTMDLSLQEESQQHDQAPELQSIADSESERRIEILKEIEDLKIRQVRATTALQIALEREQQARESVRLAQVDVHHAREECQQLALRIRSAQGRLVSTTTTTTVVEDSDAASIGSTGTGDISERRQENHTFSTPIRQTVSYSSPMTDTTEACESDSCMCEKFGDAIIMENVQCSCHRGRRGSKSPVDHCHLQFQIPTQHQQQVEQQHHHGGLEMSGGRFLYEEVTNRRRLIRRMSWGGTSSDSASISPSSNGAITKRGILGRIVSSRETAR